MEATPDGGYIIVGDTYSNNGDVSGNHGLSDIWVVKIDEAGEIEWQRCYGGSASDNSKAIAVLNNSAGYVFTGNTESEDGDLIGTGAGTFPNDISGWTVRIDLNGNIIWQNFLHPSGGLFEETSVDVICIADTIYHHFDAVAGSPPETYTYDYNGITIGTSGAASGGPSGAVGGAICECPGGTTSVGYAGQESFVTATLFGGASGVNLSPNGRLLGCAGSVNGGSIAVGWSLRSDLLIIKSGSTANQQWRQEFGGSGWYDQGNSVIQDAVGRYVVAGKTNSTDGDVAGLHGTLSDAWLIAVDGLGQLIWQRCFGGLDDDEAARVLSTSDGYIMAGSTVSNDFDVSGNHGGSDVWIVRLQAGDVGVGEVVEPAFSVSPNPIHSACILKFDAGTKPRSITLRDAAGRAVSSITVTSDPFALDMSNYDAGLYMIQVDLMDGTKAIQRVVKN
jgi:hypothetical protein